MLELTLNEPVEVPSAGLLADDHALLVRCDVGAHDAGHAVAETVLRALLDAAPDALAGPSPVDSVVAVALDILGAWPAIEIGLDLVAVVVSGSDTTVCVAGSGGILADRDTPRAVVLPPMTVRYTRPDLEVPHDDPIADVVVRRLARDAKADAVRTASLIGTPLIATVDPVAFEALRKGADPSAHTALGHRPAAKTPGAEPRRWLCVPPRRGVD